MNTVTLSHSSFSADSTNHLSVMSQFPGFSARSELKREETPRYECGLVKKIKLADNNGLQTESELNYLQEQNEVQNDNERLFFPQNSKQKNINRTKTLVILDQKNPDGSYKETTGKPSSSSSLESLDLSFRQYDLQTSLQRAVVEETLCQQAEGNREESRRLNRENNIEAEVSLNTQQIDKNLIGNPNILNHGSIANPINFMVQIDAAYQASVQSYLRQKQTRFDRFMKKMEDILSLCTEASVEALENRVIEDQNKPDYIKYVDNKKVSEKKKGKQSKSKRNC